MLNFSAQEARRLAALVGRFDGSKTQTRAMLREAQKLRRSGAWELSDAMIDVLIGRLVYFRTQTRFALRLARLAVRTCPDRLHLLQLARVLESLGLEAESQAVRASASDAPYLHPPSFPGLGLDDSDPRP
jgi:hypothetical protein